MRRLIPWLALLGVLLGSMSTAYALLPTYDPINWAQNSAQAASAAKSAASEAEQLKQMLESLRVQRDQLQAQLDALKNIDLNTLEGTLQGMRQVDNLLASTRRMSYQVDRTGEHFDKLYGRIGKGRPFHTLRRELRRELDNYNRDLHIVQSNAETQREQIAKDREELYKEMNGAENDLQATKMGNEIEVQQSAQLSEILRVAIAESRRNQVEAMIAQRSREEIELNLKKFTSDLGERDPSEPIATTPILFSNGAAGVRVPPKKSSDRPRPSDVNHFLAKQVKSLASAYDVAKSISLTLLMLLGTAEFAWIAIMTLLSGGGAGQMVRPIFEKAFLLAIFAAIVSQWGRVADAVYSFIVSTGAKLGGNSSGVVGLDPASIANTGIYKVEQLFRPETISKGFDASNFSLTGLVTEGIGASAPMILIGFVTLICALAVMGICFYVGAQLYIAQLEFMVISSVAACFLPFGMNKHTSFLANAAFSAVIASAVKVAVLAAIFGLSSGMLAGASLGTSPTITKVFGLLFIVVCFGYAMMNSRGVAAMIFSGAGGGLDLNGISTQIAGAATGMATGGTTALAGLAGSGIRGAGKLGAKGAGTGLKKVVERFRPQEAASGGAAAASLGSSELSAGSVSGGFGYAQNSDGSMSVSSASKGYNSTFHQEMNQLGGVWNPESQQWTVPAGRAGEVQGAFDRSFGEGALTPNATNAPPQPSDGTDGAVSEQGPPVLPEASQTPMTSDATPGMTAGSVEDGFGWQPQGDGMLQVSAASMGANPMFTRGMQELGGTFDASSASWSVGEDAASSLPELFEQAFDTLPEG